LFSISAKYYCVDRHDHRLAANRFPKVNRTSAASIEKPIHNVKVPMNDAEAPFKTRPKAGTVVFISGKRLVEPIGIEPMTPCLQSRCSPS
jgi:hypothetical protein